MECGKKILRRVNWAVDCRYHGLRRRDAGEGVDVGLEMGAGREEGERGPPLHDGGKVESLGESCRTRRETTPPASHSISLDSTHNVEKRTNMTSSGSTAGKKSLVSILAVSSAPPSYIHEITHADPGTSHPVK